MRRYAAGICAGVLALSLLLTGCGATPAQQKKYEASFLTLFNTVTYIQGYASSQEEFTQAAQAIHDDLERYHQLFDIYYDYAGIPNLKTVNDQAGIAPVVVDEAILDLLEDCRSYYALTGGMVNAAMGSVLSLWHQARTDSIDDPQNAYTPSNHALEEAQAHTSWDTVIIDRDASTVYLSDPAQSLDVGAVAKGWAAQKAAEQAPQGMLLSVGGNVCATGPKPDGSPWGIGVTDPADGVSYLHTLDLSRGCAVTSGDYQRYFTVDGRRYHHIIHPQTAYPATLWTSVTVVCDDSALADALSTALFLLPQGEGQALLDAAGAEALWIDANGTQWQSPGFEALIRSETE